MNATSPRTPLGSRLLRASPAFGAPYRPDIRSLVRARSAASPSRAARRESLRRLETFAAIGVGSTVAYVALYALLRAAWPASVASAAALLATAVGNTAANRRLTFRARGRDGLARDHLAGLLALGAALLITSGSLAALHFVAPRAGRVTEVVVLVAANAAATVVRFLLLRLVIDGRRPVGSEAVGRPVPRPERAAGSGARVHGRRVPSVRREPLRGIA